MANQSKLKAWVRVDGTGKVVTGGPILQVKKPTVGNWREINANECCNYVLPSNCIEFVADTTLFNQLFFGMQIGVLEDITYTVTWGDSTTGEGTIVAGDPVEITHEYTGENTAYNVQMCFSDPTKVAYLEFYAAD